ncbi:MAG: methionyl-tRNA formyltransferase [Synergistaceae bacterium]|jgi:methionyl-tRNA formyltransferase|nr:methionyl-tRNA formyltransferase [Synergistaceae bacterium]
MTRIWFVGGGAFAALCLARLRQENLAFEKVLTGLPTRAGRGLSEQVSHVERAAVELGLPVERTGPLAQNEKLLELLSSDPPDVVFVVDFGQIIREPLLNAPRYGCLNIHPSFLPRWRGAAPVQRALLNGDSVTGVTVFRLVEAMDAGPILGQAEIPLPLTTSASQLFDVLAFTGSQIAARSVESLGKASCQTFEQNSELATYADKLSKAEARVLWSRDYLQIHNAVRAFASSIGAFTFFEGKRLKLWRTLPLEPSFTGVSGRTDFDETAPRLDAGAGSRLDLGSGFRISGFVEGDPVVACKGGSLRLMEVQPEGGRKMSGAEWARGIPPKDEFPGDPVKR